MMSPGKQLRCNQSLEGLAQLQRLLETVATASGSDLATVASPKHLGLLRTAAHCLASSGSQTAADSAFPVTAVLLSCAELVIQQLQEPCAELYSNYGGAPCQTPAELQLAGTTYQELVATKLQILLLLLQHLGPVQLSLQAEQQTAAAVASEKDDSRARNRPDYVVGIVEITEEPDIPLSAEQQLQTRIHQLVTHAILICALYAASSCSNSSENLTNSSSNSSIDQNTGSCRVNSSKAGYCSLEGYCQAVEQQGWELFTPWSEQQCQQYCQEQLLQHVAVNTRVVTEQSAAAVRAARAKHHVEQQQEDEGKQQWGEQLQQLLHALLPQLLDCLRDALLAQHRHRRLHDKGDVVPYKGPDIFHRCLAARQLAWVIQQLSTPQLSQETCSLLLPLVLATVDDPAPSVQQYGHAMLSWLAVYNQHGVLSWQHELLMDEAKRLVVGCEDSCWRTAMPAATNLVLAVEKKHDVRAAGYHILVQELVTEAERNAQNAQKRLVFMASIAKLIPCLGLYVVRYFAQLMPLLLEWVHAYDEGTVVVALQLLGLVVKHAWPRMGAHAPLLWEHLVEVARTADAKAWMSDLRAVREQQGQCERQSPSSELVSVVVDLGQLLCLCGGERFAAALRATASAADVGPTPAKGSPTFDALLQACLQVTHV